MHRARSTTRVGLPSGAGCSGNVRSACFLLPGLRVFASRAGEARALGAVLGRSRLGMCSAGCSGTRLAAAMALRIAFVLASLARRRLRSSCSHSHPSLSKKVSDAIRQAHCSCLSSVLSARAHSCRQPLLQPIAQDID